MWVWATGRQLWPRIAGPLVIAFALSTPAQPSERGVPALLVDGPAFSLGESSSPALDSLLGAPGVSSLRLALAEPSPVLAARGFSLVLPDTGETLVFEHLEATEVPSGTLLTTPLAAGGRAERAVRLVLTPGGDVVGSVLHDARPYALRPLGGGLTALYRFNPRFAERVRSLQPADFIVPSEEDLAPSATERELRDARDEIDLLIAYTPRVREQVVNVEATVDLLLSAVHDIYERSGVTTRLNLVHLHETAHGAVFDSQIRPSRTDLTQLTVAGDGRFDAVHGLRDAYAADVVVLLTGTERYSCYGGIA